MSGMPEEDILDEEAPPSSLSEIPLELGESSMPAPEEIRMSARSNNTGGRRMKTIMCYSLFFLVLLACFVGLGVGLASRGSSGGSGSERNSDTAQKRQFSFEDVAAYLEQEGISDSQELLSFPTPQSQAARWLANEDPRNLALPPTGVDSQQGYHFITRYILATVYYALSGADWRYQFNFLTGEDICSWRGTLYVKNTGQPLKYGSVCDGTGEISALYLGMYPSIIILAACCCVEPEQSKVTHCFISPSPADSINLDGAIPSELTKLTTLRALDLNYNDNIRGTVPSDIGSLSLLQYLALSRNLLTGNIPQSVCDLTFLEVLHLGYNNLIGNIPSCIGSLINLEFIFVSCARCGSYDERIRSLVWLNRSIFFPSWPTMPLQVSFRPHLRISRNSK